MWFKYFCLHVKCFPSAIFRAQCGEHGYIISHLNLHVISNRDWIIPKSKGLSQKSQMSMSRKHKSFRQNGTKDKNACMNISIFRHIEKKCLSWTPVKRGDKVNASMTCMANMTRKAKSGFWHAQWRQRPTKIRTKTPDHTRNDTHSVTNYANYIAQSFQLVIPNQTASEYCFFTPQKERFVTVAKTAVLSVIDNAFNSAKRPVRYSPQKGMAINRHDSGPSLIGKLLKHYPTIGRGMNIFSGCFPMYCYGGAKLLTINHRKVSLFKCPYFIYVRSELPYDN